MKLLMRAIIIYFPIVFIYKLFGNPSNNYWINAYWFAVSIDYIFFFLGVKRVVNYMVSLYEEKTIKIYKDIALASATYWGIMAIIRLYLFFNIEMHYSVIESAGKITTGVICIVIIFIYLSAKQWYKK